MDIGEALYSRLAGYSALTALVDTRIYPTIAPENATLPRITYQVVSNVPIHAMVADAGLYRPRVQVDVWAGTYSSMAAVAAQVKAALQDYSGTIGTGDTLTVQRAFLEVETDGSELDEKTRQITYRRLMEFIIWHE